MAVTSQKSPDAAGGSSPAVADGLGADLVGAADDVVADPDGLGVELVRPPPHPAKPRSTDGLGVVR